MEEAAAETPPKPPRRILVVVGCNSDLWRAAWRRPEEVVAHALRLIGEDELAERGRYDDPATCLYLGSERFDRRANLVFDIYHAAYDFDTAHLPSRNHLPVTRVRLGRRGHRVKAADPALAARVNREVANVHNLSGWWRRPPLVVNYAMGNVPVFPHPRSSTPRDSQEGREEAAVQIREVRRDIPIVD
ncbi:hypothetical protein VTK73DRAFT_4636 [Phialemonium thermophilum]|uniref:Uncharacterized protein n=1 Tax=Phialemonium thermophilum TaxID=223376 RepID=A0ABR3V7T1_9PEZI